METTTAPTPPRRLVGIWAHPDDEAYLSAGLMDSVVRAGGEVTLVALTDGEAGFDAADPRSPDERRRVRGAELRAAAETVGVHDVRRLGLPDGEVPAADAVDLVGTLGVILDQVRPDVVVTFGPDGMTGHDDHVACSALVTRAWLERPFGQLWYATKTPGWMDDWRDLHQRFGVWMGEEPRGTEPRSLAHHLDLRGPELLRKRSVLAAHRSQTEGLAQAFGEPAYRAWIAEESFRWASPTELALQAAASVGVLS